MTNLQWLAVTCSELQWLSDLVCFGMFHQCDGHIRHGQLVVSHNNPRKWMNKFIALWILWPCLCRPGRADLGICAQRPGSALSNSSSGIYTVPWAVRRKERPKTFPAIKTIGTKISKDQQLSSRARDSKGKDWPDCFFFVTTALAMTRDGMQFACLNSPLHQFHVGVCLSLPSSTTQ